MPNNLEVSFNSPQCGWMSIGFADAAGEFHTTTAHAPHEHALPELLEILTALLNGQAEQEFTLAWNRNPEEFDFYFRRAGENLRLEIYQYPSDERLAAERELVFAHDGQIADVCRAFQETFAQLYADRDTDEFEFNWRQKFPFAEYEKFENLMENYGK